MSAIDTAAALGLGIESVTVPELDVVDTDAGCCTIPASATGAITPSDVVSYDPPLRAIWATGAGTICVRLSGDPHRKITLTVAAHERVTFLSIAAVLNTGTSATGISGAS